MSCRFLPLGLVLALGLTASAWSQQTPEIFRLLKAAAPDLNPPNVESTPPAQYYTPPTRVAPAPAAQPAHVDSAPVARQSLSTQPRLETSVATHVAHDARAHADQTDCHDTVASTDSGRNVHSSSPVLTVELEGPFEINSYKRAEFRFVIKHAGGDKAKQVQLEVNYPARAEFDSSHPAPKAAGKGVLTFDVGAMAAGDEREVRVNLLPKQKGRLELGALLHFAAATQVAVDVKQPEMLVKVAGPEAVHFGEKITHTVSITNPGDGPAENLVAIANFPDGVAEGEPQQSQRVPTLAPGETREVTFTTTARKGGLLDFEFQCKADGGLSTTAEHQVNVLRPDLNIQIVGPELNFLNKPAVYLIVVENLGDSDAENVKLTTVVPPGMVVNGFDRSPEVDNRSRALTWKFDRIPAGGEVQVKLSQKGLVEGPQPQRFAAAADHGLHTEVNHRTLIAKRADLTIQVVDTAGPVKVGEPTEFTVTIENRGTASASNVAVAVKLPEGVTAAPGAGYELRDGTLTYAPFGLAAGDRKALTFVAQGEVPGERVVRAIMKSDDLAQEVGAEDSVFFFELKSTRVSDRERRGVR